MQQFCHQAAVACIGYGDQQTAFRCQPLAACSQDALGLAKVLQHVGADDVVIARIAEELVQIAILQVGHMDMAVEGRGMAGLFLAQRDAVADALLVLGEKGSAHRCRNPDPVCAWARTWPASTDSDVRSFRSTVRR